MEEHKTPRNSVLLSTVRSLPLLVPIAVSKGYSPVRLAFTSLLRVLQNSFLFIAIGWLFGYCFTLGNIFSKLPPSQQSIPVFNAANMAWWYLVFATCMVIIISAKLPREQFVWRPSKPFLYIAAFWGFYSMVIVDVYARRIFQTQTRRFWVPSCRRVLYVYGKNMPVIVFTMISIDSGDS
ncbi:uncharacterized protein PITG_00830 [Phytophthora infestans T30-4]|uniref:Uncharacterized protein n=1 Tax=Phytophthora infestans (strain T30-4) TaxID=403677 RepID=D0MRS7_PHYIT|nr:uncharacterized protein PITG_00830 [Phytophthora infestans T30-4]EEY58196.1 conserved hypothetical protein [Phytophthora infestans T30-4]|eukprot:XP_002909382.1 conserved hypothetical protein [Phytophthora infestans T30-4]